MNRELVVPRVPLEGAEYYRRWWRVVCVVLAVVIIGEGITMTLNYRNMVAYEPWFKEMNHWVPLEALGISLLVFGVMFAARVVFRGPLWIGTLGTPVPFAINAYMSIACFRWALKYDILWQGVILYGVVAVLTGIIEWIQFQLLSEERAR